MMPEDRRHASAVDRYWDELALTGDASAADDLEPETAAQIDRLWAFSAPPATEVARQRVWQRVQARADESPAGDRLSGLALDAPTSPPWSPNGRFIPFPSSGQHAPWWRNAPGQLATAALLVLVLVASLLATGTIRPAGNAFKPANGPLAEFRWLATGGPSATFGEPIQPAIDAAGNLWVSDAAHAHNRFLIFAPDGTFLEAWGAPGSGEGEFAFSCSGVGMGGVAFDGAGNIYVADAGNQRVQKFGPNRTFITQWGSPGTADDQFLCPAAIAVDREGRVLVADQGWGKIKVFAGDGVWLATWSGLQAPIDLAIAGDDVWVADSDGGIVRFSAEGERLGAWDASAVGDEAVNDPTGIAVDAQGRVYVTDAGANRVQVFAPDGTVLGGWGARGKEAGQFQEPRGIALAGDGAAYVADYYGERLQKFQLLPPLAPGYPLQTTAERTPEGTARFAWEYAGAPDQSLGFSDRMALDPAGNIWITDNARDQFQIVSPDGAFLETWGTPGAGEGEFNLSAGYGDYNQGAVAFDSAGNIFVLDGANRRIQKFAPDRSFLAAWGSEGTGAGQFQAPGGIAVDLQGRVIVLDSQRHDLQVFDSDGVYLQTIGGYGAGEGEFGFGFGYGGAVSVAPDGTLWVADYHRNRIQQFAPDGAFLAAYGAYGTGEGQFINPGSVAVDAQGRIFVADAGNHRIQVLAPDGAFLASWGERGTEAGQFIGPREISLIGSGAAYVVDGEYARIQKFQLLPPLAPG